MAEQKKLNDFLKDFFQWSQLQTMNDGTHVEQWAQFNDYIDNNDLTDNMQKWVKKFIVKNPTTNKPEKHNVTNEYYLIDFPAQNDMSDEDWEKLFTICQNILANMKQSGVSLDPKAQDFVNEWSSLFVSEEHTQFVATSATENQITDLGKLLENARSVLERKLQPTGEWGSILGGNRNDRISYTALLNGIKNREYNKSENFQNIVINLANQISKETDPDQNPKAKDALANLGLNEKTNYSLIGGEGWKHYKINPSDISKFKQQYPLFLKDIFTESKISDALKQHEGENNQISTALEKAKNDTDYNNKDSKDFVYPKREDVLTPYQQISKWCSETYDDSFKKYFTLRGDRLFFAKQSMEICKAITKAGIKPSDGLAKILTEKDKIKQNLGHTKKSQEAFDWLASTLQEFQNDPKLKKTFAGALKNGSQMRHLVEEMILKAISESVKTDGTMDDKGIEKVKIAMETLSAIRYSLVTSKTMEALRDQTFSIFSDKSLSWNKNEGVQFVTNALDKTIGFAFKTATYGVSMGVNIVRRRGSKFNNKMGKKFERAYNNWDTINNKNKAEQRKSDYEQSSQADKNRYEKDVQDAYRSLTARRHNIAASGMSQPEVVDMLEDELNDKGLEEENNAFSKYAPLQARLDEYNDMLACAENIKSKQDKIDKTNPGAKGDVAKEQEISEYTKNKLADIEELNRRNSFLNIPIQGLESALQAEDFQAVVDCIEREISILKQPNSQYNKARNNYETVCRRNDRKRNNIDKFREASKRLKEINDTQEKHEKIVNSWDAKHKDYFHDLMNFWDMLDSGKAKMTNSNVTKAVRFDHNFTVGKKSAKQKAIFNDLGNGYSLDY